MAQRSGRRSELRALLDTVKNKPLTRADFTDLHFTDAVPPVERREIIDKVIDESAVIVAAKQSGAQGPGRRYAAEVATRYDGYFDDSLSGGRAERAAALNAMNESQLAEAICNRGMAG